MSNIAFNLEVFRQVSASAAGPPPGNALIAALGSIGPDLYRYIPVSTKLSDALHATVQKTIQSLTPAQVQAYIQAHTAPPVDMAPILNDPALALELFEKPLMAAYSIVFGEIVMPFWGIIQRDLALLDQLQTAANSQDADALKALSSSKDQLESDSAELQKLPPVTLGVMGGVLPLVALPPAIEAVSPQAKPWLPQTNRLFEFLRWHHTDVFAKNLVKLADTDDKKAYAYGHLCHIAASVAGKPFINNIAGGPYRTHWWRNRLVSNFVDTWTFGRYETPATMTGDEPNPPYLSWSSICAANLQNRFDVAGFSVPADKVPDAVQAVATGQLGGLPGQFPQDLAEYIQKAIDDSYPVNLRPPGYSAEAIKEAFVGLFAVVWFMTSGFGPMTPFDLGPAPSGCTPGGGSGPQPSGPSTAATVCGVLLAIAAAILFLFGQYGEGIAAVIAAIELFMSGGGVDWNWLQCKLFETRKNLLDGNNALVRGLVTTALAYPAPDKLGTVDANKVTHPGIDIFNGGLPLTKSMPSEMAGAGKVPYPHQMDATNAGYADLNFGIFPVSGVESPETTNLPLSPCYADAVIDGSGLKNGGMLTDGAFPSRNLFFGDAVANATELINDQAKNLPSYNLDADRGYGWKTWRARIGTFPGTGDVDKPQEEL